MSCPSYLNDDKPTVSVTSAKNRVWTRYTRCHHSTGNLGVLLTGGDLLLLLLLLVGVLGLAGVKLVALSIDGLLIIIGLPGVELIPIGVQLLLVIGLPGVELISVGINCLLVIIGLPGVELIPIGIDRLIVISGGTCCWCGVPTRSEVSAGEARITGSW